MVCLLFLFSKDVILFALTLFQEVFSGEDIKFRETCSFIALNEDSRICRLDQGPKLPFNPARIANFKSPRETLTTCESLIFKKFLL